MFRDIHNMIERKHNVKVRNYRLDNELVSYGVFMDWIRKNGITLEPSVPNSHHMNGVAERAFRTEREKAASMMQDAKLSQRIKDIIKRDAECFLNDSSLPETLWNEAFKHALWLKNRSPTRALKVKKTPWEASEGTKPDLSREQLWGSRVYVTFPPESRLKSLLQPRGWIGYFVGHDSESVYLIYNPDTKKVKRVDQARVEQGQGLDDSGHDESPLGNSQAVVAVRHSNVKTKESGTPEASEASEPEMQQKAKRPRNLKRHLVAQGPGQEESDSSERDMPVVKKSKGTKTFLTTLPTKEAIMLDLLKSYEENTLMAKVYNAIFTDRTRSRQSVITARHHFSHKSQSERDEIWPKLNDAEQRTKMEERVKLAFAQLKIDPSKLTIKREGYKQTRYTADESLFVIVAVNRGTFSGKALEALHQELFPNLPHRSASAMREKAKNGDISKEDQVLRNDMNARINASKTLSTSAGNRTQKYSRATDRIIPKCRNCKKQQLLCTGEPGPCSSCIKNKHVCNFGVGHAKYVRQGDDEWVGYYGDHCPMRERLQQAEGELDPECCFPCREKSRKLFGADVQGDGEFPCNKCVETAEKGVKLKTKDKVPPEGMVYKNLYVTCVQPGPNGSLRHHRMRAGFAAITPSIRKGKPDLDEAEQTAVEYSSNDEDISRTLAQPSDPKAGTNEGGNESPHDHHRVTRTRTRNPHMAREAGSYRPRVICNDSEDEEGLDKTISAQDEYDSDYGNDLEKVAPTRNEYDDSDDDAEIVQRDFAHLTYIDPCHLNLITSIQQQNPSCMTALSLDTDPEPRTRAQALRSSEAKEWSMSMDEEHNSLIENDTFEYVPRPANRKVLKSRWVYKRKRGPDGKVKRHKSRWVCKGFTQVHGLDFDETYASVVKSPSYRLFFALQAKLGWKCRQIDVETAFLNGELDHEIYIEAPDGYPAPSGMVCKLKRALYGLKQSPRMWYQKLREYMESIGWRVSSYDQSVYIGPNQLFMTVYVDDIRLYGLDDDRLEAVIQQLASRFKIKDLGEGDFYLGMHVHQADKGDIHIHQTAYLKERITKYGFDDLRPVDTPMDSNNKLTKNEGEKMTPQFQKTYQSIMGSLNYASIVSRPDISTAVGILCRYNSDPNEAHLAAAKRVFAYLKHHLSDGLLYKRHTEGDLNDLHIMSDADWAGSLDDRKSTSGYVVMFAGAPISWTSKKQDCNALSSCEAEYVAGSIAAQEAIWFKNMINDLGIPGIHVDSVPFYVDNESAIAVSKNPEHHSRMKHIENRMHFLRDHVQKGDIDIKWVPSKENLADFLTKPLAKDQHHYLRILAGIVPASCDVINELRLKDVTEEDDEGNDTSN